MAYRTTLGSCLFFFEKILLCIMKVSYRAGITVVYKSETTARKSNLTMPVSRLGRYKMMRQEDDYN